MGSSAMLTLTAITKSFPGVVANDHVDLEVHAGEVHALVGENGAGKSTLMKILYGFLRPDAGLIRLDGQPVQIRSPQDARAVAHRHGVPGFRAGARLQRRRERRAVPVRSARRAGPPALVRRIAETSDGTASRSSRAPVLAALRRRATEGGDPELLLADARILILDEPTRSLAPHEVEGLFRVLADLRRDGYAVVLIAHKMQEVLACADRITVMRRGRVAGTVAGEATEARWCR